MTNHQLGLAEESTYGTGVAVTRFLPFRSATVTADVARLDDPGIVGGQRAIRRSQLATGRRMATAEIEYSLFQSDIAYLFKHALGGTPATVDNLDGTYTHTMSPGSTDGLGLTVQGGFVDNADVAQAKTLVGGKVRSLTMSVSTDDVTLSASVEGQDMKTPADGGVFVLQTEVLPSGLTRFLPEHFTMTLDETGAAGETSQCVRAFSITIENTIDLDRYCLGTTIRKEPLLLKGQNMVITGTIDLEWDDLNDYNRYVAQTITGATFTIDNGEAGADARSIVGTMDIETTSDPVPSMSGGETLYAQVRFRAVENTAPSDALQVAIKDNNSAP